MPEAAHQPWNRTGEDKRDYVRRMFAEISPTYDFLNSAMSLRLHHRWRAEAAGLLNLSAGQLAADVCCGTGDFGLPLRRAVKEGGVLGVDFCQPMLLRAKSKPSGMKLVLGDACRLPVRSDTFHGVTVGWGLRNVPDLELALREIHRVLLPGGRFVSVDMAVPASKFVRAAGSLLFNRAVPLLGSAFGRREAYTYLPKSTERFTSREDLARVMAEAGFKSVRWRDRFFGNICIHWGEK